MSIIFRLFHSIVLLFILSLFFSGCEQLRRIIQETSDPVTEEEVIRGLRQALEFGAEDAAELASMEGGFYDDNRLQIPFPPEAQRVEETLRDIGLSNLVDDFVLHLNRSAENAAEQAAPILLNAISDITISDGLDILHGDDNAATQYLYRQTAGELESAFRPIIQQALDETQTTRYWNDITTRYNQIPFVQNVETHLASYTTNRTIDGLFVLIEDEEKEIRNNPSARITELLKRVFRQQDEEITELPS
ncbi:MAG: DUF4197 domain-containing protein [Balneolales bacterium]